MSMSRIRIQIVALAFLLFPAAAGILAVHASATCERFVRNYVTKPVRNRVSKQTAEAWAKWRVDHPNWKPNPNIHRPKYVMTRQEAVDKIAFACTIPEVPSAIDGFLKTAAIDPPPPIIDLARMTPTQLDIPDVMPPEIAELTPDNSWPSLGPLVPPVLSGPFPGGPGFPIVPPTGSTPSGFVPEPSSLLLSGSGLAIMLLGGTFFRIRRKMA